jgi:hypothetical protein
VLPYFVHCTKVLQTAASLCSEDATAALRRESPIRLNALRLLSNRSSGGSGTKLEMIRSIERRRRHADGERFSNGPT